jgi:cytochrome c556
MRLAIGILGVIAAAIVSGGTHAASGEEVIKARINFMKDEMEGHWKPLAAYASKGTGSLADVEKNASSLAKLAEKIPAHFPKDTGRGKYPDKLTRALPAIWEDWEGFKQDAQVLAEQSAKLARLAKEGKKDAVIDLIGASGSYAKTNIGCAECHADFRGARVK